MSVTEVCNEELGTPYHRCLRLFDEAKENCDRTLFFFSFLCYIIVPFRSLCGVAKSMQALAPLQSVSVSAEQTPAHCGDPILAETILFPQFSSSSASSHSTSSPSSRRTSQAVSILVTWEPQGVPFSSSSAPSQLSPQPPGSCSPLSPPQPLRKL